MLLLRLVTASCRASGVARPALSPSRKRTAHALRRSAYPGIRLFRQQRCYASCDETRPPAREELQQKARAASRTAQNQKLEFPEKVLIYHAGTGRTTFLAMLKVSSLFLGAFFILVAVPSYVKAERPTQEVAGIALCGIIPLCFVSLVTSAFVTHIHIHLPPSARASKAQLVRFSRSLILPSTPLTVTTMSLVAKPRYSSLAVGDLVPVRRRLGLVNYVRSTSAAEAEKQERRWYMFRAVKHFYVQEVADSGKKRNQQGGKTRKTAVESWLWDVIRDQLPARAASG